MIYMFSCIKKAILSNSFHCNYEIITCKHLSRSFNEVNVPNQTGEIEIAH